MKRTAAFLILTVLGAAPLSAMPSQITFQGTLKQDGVPVNATKNLQISFVDGTGAPIPGTPPTSIANVQVTNGLFAVQLPIDPSIPWEQYAPFIRVSVEGQILTPDQPLNANLYAVAAIPQGLIAMFAKTCPVGWSEFTALQGRFPVGNDPNNGTQFSPGEKGGNLTHNHGGATGPPTEQEQSDAGLNFLSPVGNHVHTIAMDSSLPPYLTLIFCQKL
jgi:hypothetical protein